MYNNTCQDPFETINAIKKRYRTGLTAATPSFSGRTLSAEDLMNKDLDLGSCDNPVVLALISSRDPMVTMSMAATARISPLAVEHKLVSGICEIIGDVSKHDEVKNCVHILEKNHYAPSAVNQLKSHVVGQVKDKRNYFRIRIRQGLQGLIDGKIAPDTFVAQFYQGMNQLNMNNVVYAQMVVDFLLSRKFRPKVKFTMMENLIKAPTAVRMQILMQIVDAPQDGHTDAIRDELYCILQDNPHLMKDPANVGGLDLTGNSKPGNPVLDDSLARVAASLIG